LYRNVQGADFIICFFFSMVDFIAGIKSLKQLNKSLCQWWNYYIR
jgi:hypothetical protein